MSEATAGTDTNSSPTAPVPLTRDWRGGLRALLRFTTHPSDLANSFDAMFSLAGPTVQREFNAFAAHPVGARLLAERPRRELNDLLQDRDKLAEMPAGSFGAAYLGYLGDEGMGSADFFLEAANLDDAAARFGWSDDHLWFVRRMANSHDLFHIVSGYDRDIIGEVGVVVYTAGQLPLLPLKLLLPFFCIAHPAKLPTWLGFIIRCYRHGKATPSLACIDYEELLPLPLEEARRRIGARTVADVHGANLPKKGWLLSRLEERVQLV